MTDVDRGTAKRRRRSEAGGTVGSRSALVVPLKRGNRPEGPRGGKEGAGDTESLEGKITEPPTSDTVSTRLQRIAELAREDPKRAFRSLAHHIDLELLQEAFRRTRKDGATGVDGQTGSEYEERLDENLRSLLDRFKSGQYKAPPVRRAYVPKGDGSQRRPIGIPTFEDKVLQRAVVMVLEAVYEQDFLACSYGYRPGRSAHHALEDLWQGLMAMGGGWILEVDIKSFFDTISHSQLREILDQRVRDGVLRRTIDKWLAAGVLEGTELSHPDAGTPQGGVVSPLLANIYLHEVLDRWFERDVKPRLVSRAFMIRFADDLVLVFASERDARRVWDVLPKRLGRYGLTLHPTKTRLVEFRPGKGGTKPAINGSKTSFDLLGFTHCWARSHRGLWVVKRKTAGSRFGRAVKRVYDWCRRYRHAPLAWQHEQLERKLRGHDNYYGISGNWEALTRFRHEVRRAWRKWLNRRSNRARMSWERYTRVLKRYPLPAPVVRHWLRPRAANP
jgi:RNA-directed DNA polymerase